MERGRLELAVFEKPGQQLVSRFFGSQLALHLDPAVRQQQAGLDLDQEAHEEEELGHLVPIPDGPRRLHVVEVSGDDLEQRDLQQVDLLLEDERQEQVERTLVDVEIEF